MELGFSHWRTTRGAGPEPRFLRAWTAMPFIRKVKLRIFDLRSRLLGVYPTLTTAFT